MQDIVNTLKSSVKIDITGAFPERFFNLCAQNKIEFWDAEPVNETCITARMSIKHFKRLHKFSRRSMCSIKYSRRKARAFFCGDSASGTHYSQASFSAPRRSCTCRCSSGTSTLSASRASTVTGSWPGLAQAGLEIGTYKPSLEPRLIVNEVLLQMDEISWIAINITGSRAVVDVRPRVRQPEIVPLSEPCDIVASKSGVIESIYTLNGTGKVAAGQTVTKGQLLVSGIVPRNYTASKVHAKAEIRARVWYDIRAVTPLQVTGKVYTGRTRSRAALVFMGQRINLYGGAEDPFDKCDKIVFSTMLTLPGSVTLPVTLVTEEFREYLPEGAHLDAYTAEQALKERLGDIVAAQAEEGVVKDAEWSSLSDERRAVVRLRCETLERIALVRMMD